MFIPSEDDLVRDVIVPVECKVKRMIEQMFFFYFAISLGDGDGDDDGNDDGVGGAGGVTTRQ